MDEEEPNEKVEENENEAENEKQGNESLSKIVKEESETDEARETVKVLKRFEEFAMLTYREATNGTDKDLWKEAIEEEKEALAKNEILIRQNHEKHNFANYVVVLEALVPNSCSLCIILEEKSRFRNFSFLFGFHFY
ncbi:hypothetical protein QE152_g5810 [Popillia japonica]|uniref:Uncharacterized protein n=1 Tax=Popillia japonica TaxID=7064 RepID=A0AAW1MMR0_POPJA